MVTVEQLSENSRQGFDVQKQSRIGLESDLSRNLCWGCGHVYDETPVDIAVYVRNDPVNLVDPDGRFYIAAHLPFEAFYMVQLNVIQIWDLQMFLRNMAWMNEPAYSPQAGGVYPPEFVGPSQNPNFVYVGNMSKSGPNQDRIRTVTNWIIENVDQDCAQWLSGLGRELTSILGDPTNEDSVLIGHGTFSANRIVNAVVGSDFNYVNSNMPPGIIVGINDDGAFFKSISGYNVGGYTGGTSQAQAFIILHEMAHYLSAAGMVSDFGNSTAVAANDALVNQKCGRTLNAAKQIP